MTLNDLKRRLPAVAFFMALCLFCGHAFCYMNLTYSGASVMVDASRMSRELSANGQFLAPLYLRLRGGAASPLMIGVLSGAYLTAAALLIAGLLGIKMRLSLFMLCGAMTLNLIVTAINASLLHIADVYFLALLCAVLGVFLCAAHPLGFVPAAGFLCACLGLQQSMASVALALLVLWLIAEALRGVPVHTLLLHALRALCAVAAAVLLYAVAGRILAPRMGTDFAFSIQPMRGAPGAFTAYLAPIVSLMNGACGAYPLSGMVLSGGLILAGLLVLIHRAGALPIPGRIAVAVLALALPLAVNAPVLSASPSDASSQLYPLIMLLVGAIAMIDFLSLRARRAAALMLGIVLMGNVVLANQVYLKKNLEYQSTLSVMTRVLDRAERTEGFMPGETPVAIIGSIEDSGLAVSRPGFEHLQDFDAAANHFTAAAESDNVWYFWSLMGYPLNLVGDGDRDVLAATPDVQAMEPFPAQSCCRMVGDTLVIKLSK